MNEQIDEQFRRAWNTTGKKFTPSGCEWWAWLGQPMTYDGGRCVNRTPEEHKASLPDRVSLMLL